FRQPDHERDPIRNEEAPQNWSEFKNVPPPVRFPGGNLCRIRKFDYLITSSKPPGGVTRSPKSIALRRRFLEQDTEAEHFTDCPPKYPSRTVYPLFGLSGARPSLGEGPGGFREHNWNNPSATQDKDRDNHAGL